MQPEPGLVSICIPTYNSAEYVVETLNSIAAQQYQPIELIIVDDCSKDDTVAVVRQWMSGREGWVRFEQNTENLGVVKTCNRLFSLVNGQYFQMLGADDLLFPEKLSKQVGFLESHPDIAMVYSNVNVIDDKGDLLHPDYFGELGYNRELMPEGAVTTELLRENFIPSPGVLLKTAMAAPLLPYDETLSFEDYDLWIRLSMKNKIACLPEVLASYRRRSNSMMHDLRSRYNLINATLTCLLKYRGIQREWDREINARIYKLAPALYRFGHPSAGFWVQQMWKTKKNYKSLIYTILSTVNYRFS